MNFNLGLICGPFVMVLVNAYFDIKAVRDNVITSTTLNFCDATLNSYRNFLNILHFSCPTNSPLRQVKTLTIETYSLKDANDNSLKERGSI